MTVVECIASICVRPARSLYRGLLHGYDKNAEKKHLPLLLILVPKAKTLRKEALATVVEYWFRRRLSFIDTSKTPLSTKY